MPTVKNPLTSELAAQLPTGLIPLVTSVAADGQAPINNAPTYFASGTGYAGYASPTDMLVLKGSASKVVRVQQMLLYVRATSQTLVDFSFIRRTTANTGGTASQPSIFAADTNDPAATAVVDLYSAAPSALGTANLLGTTSAFVTATTAAPNVFQLLNTFPASNAQTIIRPVTLRGTAQSLAFNFGSALPTGFTATWSVVWTESDE